MSEHTETQWRVVCAYGQTGRHSATETLTLDPREFVEWLDSQARHRNCGPHKVESRSVHYSAWTTERGKCTEHNPVQHRDGRPPWCKACGLTAEYTEPVATKFLRTTSHHVSVSAKMLEDADSE